MVAERRFGPVVVVLFLVVFVLLARLFQVQVLQHSTWAAEADSLVRSSRVLPSHRGSLLDRHGRVLAEDQDLWKVEIVYRDFRREHPLGIVAQARSTLEMRAVPLAEASQHLDAWAREILELSPSAIDRFARGGEISTDSLTVPEAGDRVREARASRASDLRFYVGALLRPDFRERRDILAAERQDPRSESSYAQIVARRRGGTAATVVADVLSRIGGQRERLARLASLLPARRSGAGFDVASVLAELESARERFENAAADALFAEATRFSPGRISTASLERVFDLEWIARTLRWDPPRARAWAATRREAFETDLAELFVPRILVHAGLGSEDELPERVLDGLAALYATSPSPAGRRGSWRDLDALCVLDEIPTLFDLPRKPRWRGRDVPALPLVDGDVREAASAFDDPWLALGTVAEIVGAAVEVPPARKRSAPGAEPEAPRLVRNAREIATRFAEIARKDPRLEGEAAHGALFAVVRALEARHLAASDAAFEACLAAAASDDGAPASLTLARERVENARQKERFLLKDLSSRPAKLVARADYPLVHLLERHADEYRGFEVRPATRRVIRARDADGAPIAGLLLGGVRGPSLREMVANEENVRKLRGGESAEDEEIGDIAAKILRADETLGSHGVEGYFDPELRGRNGWLETAGLDEDQSRGMLRAAIDGKDIVLTLDLDLQRAAQETLAHPIVPASEAQPDRGWLEHPVGAIVLLTPDGEVLAAASEPTRADPRPAPGRDLERTVPRERTLTKWPFTPPGSVFKPFVAAYAIDRLGLDPDTRTFSCAMLDDGGGGYKTIHCHIPPHGTTRLSLALAVSCNAAFGQIGEMYRPEDMLDMMEVFGFSAPTGIRQFRLPADGSGPRRPGLTEHGALPYAEKLTGALRDERERRRFANGLGWIEATPMQIARALAGLVTGRLPEVRIAREIDGRPVEHVAHALGISARAREIICRDLEGVVETPSGTAWNKGLDRASLGFRFACKTGSADKREMSEELGGPDQMVKGQKKTIKQTWIAGWFPVEQPRAILVVMLHDVTETSTHTSVHLASQFLRTPAVQRFAAGLPPEEPGAGAEKRADEAAAPRDDPSDGHAEPAAGAETAPGGVR